MPTLSYKDAGVNLELYDQAMLKLPALMAGTHSRRVLPLEGGFAGLFRLQDERHAYQDPVLVSGTDGVGTKIRVAQLVRRYDTIGIDLVAMCVNDCLCVGAQPLFFLDYLAMAQDDPEQHYALVKGVRDGCLLAHAALIGGETAIMPGLYAPGDFDLAGFCVGVVERSRIIDGSGIRPGDVLIGVASTGLHSNGFSLVRKAVFDTAGLGVDDQVPELGATVGDILLTPTRIYTDVTSRLLSDPELAAAITGIAHITGGGLADNVVRVLPGSCRAVIDRSRWDVPAVFSWVQKLGNIDREEMFRVFNMGVGLVLVCRAPFQQQVQQTLAEQTTRSFAIGVVTEGPQAAEYVN
jgi:phosphoribosylformylglycinamidine cyclo-ligase